MKATAQKAKTKQPPKQQRTRDRVQAKVRPGAGNRHRADALERQADDAARMVLSGQTHVARMLTPAQPAFTHLGNSAGTSLPGQILVDMEARFGANLGAVRIHYDALAAAVAEQQGAQAFAAGPHIYFARGAYSPHTEPGRSLLAHEIAHVLQQTAKPDPFSEFRATPITGSGAIQKKESSQLRAELERFELFKTVPDLDTIIAHHKAANPDNADLVTHTDDVKKLLDKIQTPHPKAADLKAITETDTFTKDRVIRAFYYDVFKAIGENLAAMKVIHWTPPKQTAAPLNDFYEDTLMMPLKWLKDTMGDYPLLRKYWKKQFVDTFRIYFFGLGRSVINLDYQRKFEDIYEEEMNAAKSPTALINNERYYYALAALMEVDVRRKAVTQIMQQSAEKDDPKIHRIYVRLGQAEWIMQTDKFEDMMDFTTLSEEGANLVEQVAPDIRELAQTAASYWGRIVELVRAFSQFKPFEKYEGIEDVLKGMKTLPSLKGFEDDLIGVVKGIFALPGGRTPSPATYKSQLDAQRKRLLNISYKYDTKLMDLMRRVEKGESFDDRSLLQHGWAQLMIFQIHYRCSTFTPKKAVKGETDGEKRAREDELVLHRLRLATEIVNFAGVSGLDKLFNEVAPVFKGTQPGQKESEFAIEGDWEIQKNVELAQMKEDFPPGSVFESAKPLTIGHLLQWSYLIYAEEMTAKLKEILAARGKDYSAGQSPIINQAIKEVEEKPGPRPFRFFMSRGKFVAAVRPEDRDSFKDLVQAHPKYKDILRMLPDDYVAAIPGPYSSHLRGLVVWAVPKFSLLVAEMKKAQGVDALVQAAIVVLKQKHAEKLKAAKKGEQIPPLPEGDMLWLAGLQAIFDSDINIRQAILIQLEGRYKGAIDELTKAAREASIHERRVSLDNFLMPLWTGYFTDDIRTYSKPNEALQMMMMFATTVSPAGDAPYQMAALILELAPIIYRKLGPEDVLFGIGRTSGTGRMDIIAGLVPHLEGTMGLMDKSADRDIVLSLKLSLPEGLQRHEQRLKDLKEQTQQRLFDVQTDFVFNSSKEGKSLSFSGAAFAMTTSDDAQYVDGVLWQVLDVYENFRYSPGIIMKPGGIHWPISKTGKSILHVQNAQGEWEERIDRGDKPLFKIFRDNKEITVTEKDDKWLDDVAYVVVTQSFTRDMARLEGLLNAFGEALLEFAEFIPGWGQAVMAARFITTILVFVASPEFEQLKDGLGAGAGEYFKKLFSKIADVFTVEALIGFLMFGEPKLPTLSIDPTPKQNKITTKYKDSPAARIGAMLKKLFLLGKRMGHSAERLHQRFELPMHQTRMFVMARPMIGLVLQFILFNMKRLSEINFEDLQLGPENAKKKVVEEMSNLGGKVTELLQTIDHFELPQELMPLEDIIGLVLDLVTDKLGGKYKVAIKILKEGLKKFGLWAKIEKAIADELREANMDPNKLWREMIRAELEPIFEGICDDFVKNVTKVLRGVPFLRDNMTVPATPDLNVQASSEGEFAEGEEEAQPHPAEHPQPVSSTFAWTISTGTPLTPAVAGDATRRLGHDFSHVRLHRGSESANVTTSMGADAITSGSHIWMRPGLEPGNGTGAGILRHELTHVLQQTGARPAGIPHSDTPSFGRPGSGIRINAAQESAADAVSRQTADGPAHTPIDPGPTSPGMIQPSLIDIIQKFFNNISDDQKLRDWVQHINERQFVRAGIDSKAKLDDEAKVLNSNHAFATALLNKIDDLAKESSLFPDFLKPVNKDIVEYIKKNHSTIIRDAMELVIKAAVEKKFKKEKDDNGQTVDKPYWEFNRALFETKLEEYLFGQTGVYFDIEFELEPSSGTGKKPDSKQIKISAPFKTFKVGSFYLGYVGGTADLWDTIIKNTFVKNKPLIPTRFNTIKPQSKAISEYKSAARLVLKSKGPAPATFRRTEFRFSDLVVKEIDEAVFPVKVGTLDAVALPVWDEYIKDADPSTYAANKKYGQIALRLGVYADKKGGNQTGAERESHHITQYLLLEYFRNRKTDKKPFRTAISNYPGVKGSSGLVDTIENPDGGDPIRVKQYEAGHGGLMPTLLVSQHTHVYGNLHVTPTIDDSYDEKASQGFTVQSEFRGFLSKYGDLVLDGKAKDLETVKKQETPGAVPDKSQVKIDGKPVMPADLHRAIYNAACKTYTWMRNDMATKLVKGLRDEEVRYYAKSVRKFTDTSIYDQTTDTIKDKRYVPNPDDMDKVAKTAKAHNASIMEDASKVGFKEM